MRIVGTADEFEGSRPPRPELVEVVVLDMVRSKMEDKETDRETACPQTLANPYNRPVSP